MTDVLDRPASADLRATGAGEPLKGGITPYLMLDGADDAIAFYQQALGAELVGGAHRMDDGRVLNARIDVNGASLMLMDPMPEHGYPAVAHAGCTLHLQVDDADRWFARATGAGMQVVMPIGDQFWGDRYGQVKDRFGVSWSFGSPLKR